MRATEFITEAISSQVFHYTGLDAALKILTTGKFELSSVAGTEWEEKLTAKGYSFFLSTTRTLTGGYHSTTGSSGVMFNLDGNWYNQRYPGAPIDYWGDRGPEYRVGGRRHEAEDRIFSKEPTISAGGIQSVHVYVKPMDEKERKSWGEYFPGLARKVLLAAKKNKIPAYLYEDIEMWRHQDPRGRVSITQRETLRGPDRPGRRSMSRSYLEPWIELVYKKSQKELSPAADKLRYNLLYYGQDWSGKFNDQGLGTDLSNARKPGNLDREQAVKVIDLMRKNNWAAPADFAQAMHEKWKAIAQQEQGAAKDAS